MANVKIIKLKYEIILFGGLQAIKAFKNYFHIKTF